MTTPPLMNNYSHNQMRLPLLSGTMHDRPFAPVKKIGLFGQHFSRQIRSTINEPMTGKNFKAFNSSIHSGLSGGSAKIGLLMKSLDGGALFSRHALAK